MRLQCPRCAAQYEIADELIPDSGREVECAVCAEIWLAGRADGGEALEGEGEVAPSPPDDDGDDVNDSPEPPRNVRLQRELPADVLDVLLSEADRERRARRRTRAMKEAATGAAGRRAEDG
ncbi:MAG: zinc-ribbon domain-containing protein, partial [Paracoccus sp. (in: a-proteobacteria)]|nr:zinc-ribbon domain-containing protein [Paracoccus sp. (in: a-proteobacteria)]